jgi:hypothetical protein
MLLQACGCASHLTEDPLAVSTDANDKAIKAWHLDDDHVMAVVGMNVELNIRSCLEDHSTAKEMWDHLKARYQQSSSALRYSIRYNLHYLQQLQDMSVEEYYIAFTKLSRQLASMVPKPKRSSLCKDCAISWTSRNKYDQENTMFDFVMGRRYGFEPIHVQLLGRPTLPTLSEALSALIAEETCLRTIAANSPLSQHSVLAVPPLCIQAAALAKTPCSHCGRTNHPDVRCFKKYPHLLAEMKAKRATSQHGTAASSSNSIQTAAPLHKESSNSSIPSAPFSGYMSANSLSSTSHSGTTCWVLDSGAFHMTSNSSHSDSCHPITDTKCSNN